MPLSAKDKRYLKSLGHHIRPSVATGKEGLNEAILSEIDAALERQELIKIKIGKGPLNRKDAVAIVGVHIQAEIVQLLGRNILLFRKHKHNSEIHFPKK